ncbi:MAG: Arm DNA-binding domain-containing protein [Alphaproteobacteria bacterium]|nr:Arm DNA-binding domain-containing protein [Alphaproteobacteria bacterium]
MSHQFYFSPHILDNLIPPKSGFDVIQDSVEPRLRMYITARGVKTFFTRKRVRGRDTRIIIGNYPNMDIKTARRKITGILAAVKAPNKIRRKKITFGALTAMFIASRIRRTPESTAKLVRAMKRMWRVLESVETSKITTAQLIHVHENIAHVSGIPTANRMREIMSGIFKFGAEEGYVTDNPADGLPRFKESRRVRPLTVPGLRRLVTAINQEKKPVIRAAFLMQIYGFECKSKIFAMRWSDLDFNNDTWLGRPLSDPAVVLLRELPQTKQWVFPHWRKHLTDPRAAWRRVAARAKVPGVRMDDVHKFLSRRLEFSPDRETMRKNIMAVLDEVL